MTSRANFLPYGRQLIEDDDIDAVVRVLRGDHLTTGPNVEHFEQALADAVDAPYAVACGNGTQALHLGVLASDIGAGDWVIVPSITFLATANAVRMTGAEVVFADVNEDTGLVGAAEVEAAAKRAKGPIKAVLPVHLAGRACDMPVIQRLAKANGWGVIEDACHALGTQVTGNDARWRVGDCQYSDAACFSFHPVKTIAMGEGGAITTRNRALADRMRKLRSHGMIRHADEFRRADLAFDASGQPHPWWYEMPEIGFNYREPDILCALGLSQLRKLDRFVERRAELLARYDRLLAPLTNLVRRVASPEQAPGWHLCSVLIDFDAVAISRADVMRRLAERGIGTQVHYIPVPWQPYYAARYGAFDAPGTKRYYERTLTLPLFPAMQDEDVDRVVDSLLTVLRA